LLFFIKLDIAEPTWKLHIKSNNNTNILYFATRWQLFPFNFR